MGMLFSHGARAAVLIVAAVCVGLAGACLAAAAAGTGMGYAAGRENAVEGH